MTPTTDYLDELNELLADPHRVARATSRTGMPVVGYIGDDVPVALILAAGALPLRLRGEPGRATPRADGFMESAFSPAVRTIAEAWVEGELDFLHTVVFSRADDSSQRVYYYLCELQRRGRCRGPRALLYDVARIARPASVDHHRDSTRRLADELGAAAAALPDALERVSARETLLDVVESRRRDESPLPGAIAWRIRHAAGSDWRSQFDDSTRAWLSRAPALRKPLRIVMAGDAQVDDAIHRVVESAGGSVVLELTHSTPGESAGAPASVDTLADRIHTMRSPVLAMRQDPAWVVRSARQVHADAVILWLIEEDEAMPWEISRQVRALREQGVPTLLLTRQRWVADESARNQVAAFIAALEVKS